MDGVDISRMPMKEIRANEISETETAWSSSSS